MDSAPMAALAVEPEPHTSIFDVEDFQNWALADLGMKPATVAENVRRVRAMQRHGFNAAVFFSNPKNALSEARSMLAEVGKRNKPTQFRNHCKVLNWLAKYAALNDPKFRDPKGDPLLHWKSPTPVRNKPTLFTPEEIKVLRSYGDANGAHGAGHRASVVVKRHRALIWLCLDLGLRRSEIATISLGDIEEKIMGLHVANPAKLGKKRDIPLSGAAFRENAPLQAWIRARYPCKSDRLFVAWSNHLKAAAPMTIEGIKRDMWKISQAVGFTVSFNRFRHFHATELLESGVDVRVMQELYGHSNINSTMWYSQVSMGRMQQELAKARRRRAKKAPT